MSLPFQHLVDDINGRLKARDVMNHIGFRTDGISVVGNKLKCYCPVHRGETFKSLQIDMETNLCQCVVKTCQANETQTLVELYALCRKVTPLAAALELASEFRLAIDPAALSELETQSLALAEAAEAKGNYADAIASLEVAASASPDSHQLLERLGRLREANGDPAGAKEAYLKACEKLGQTDPELVIGLLTERILPLDPDDLDVLTVLANHLKSFETRQSEYRSIMAKRAQLLHRAGRTDEAIYELDAVAENPETSPEILVQLADLFVAAERSGEAKAPLLRAASAYRDVLDLEAALPLYERIAALPGCDFRLLYTVAELYFDLGDEDGYRQRVAALLDGPAKDLSPAEKDAFLEEAAQRIPGDLPLLRALVATAENLDSPALLRDRLFALLEGLRSADIKPEAREVLARLATMKLTDAHELVALGEALEWAGNKAKAEELFLRAAAAFLVIHELDESEQLFQRVIRINRAREEEILRLAIDGFRAQEFPRVARKYLLKLATILERSKREPELIRLYDEALSITPADEELLQRRLELILATEAFDRLEAAAYNSLKVLLDLSRHHQLLELFDRVTEQIEPTPRLIKLAGDAALAEDDADKARYFLLLLSRHPEAAMEDRLAAVEQAIEQDIGDYEALIHLADLQKESGNLESARVNYRAAVEMMLSDGAESRAMETLELLLATDPENGGLRREAARLAQNAGDPIRAERFAREALTLAFAHSTIDEVRALYAELTADFPVAATFPKQFAEWLEQRGDHQAAAVIFADGARIARSNGDPATALALLESSERNNPHDQTPLFLRAEIEAERGNGPAAAELLRRIQAEALEDSRNRERLEFLATLDALEPGEAFELAKLRVYAEDSQGAIDLLTAQLAVIPDEDAELILRFAEPLLALDPTRHEPRRRYAHALAQTGRKQEAAAQFRQLAHSMIEADEDEAALPYLTMARSLDPDHLDCQRLLVEVQLRQKTGGVELRENALRLVELYDQQGDAAGSLSLLEKLNVSLGGDASITERIAALYDEGGKPDEGREAWREAVRLHEAAGSIDDAMRILSLLEVQDRAEVSDRRELYRFQRDAGRGDEALRTLLVLVIGGLESDDESALDEFLNEFAALGLENWGPVQSFLERLEPRYPERAIALAEESIARFDAADAPTELIPAAEWLLMRRPDRAEVELALARAYHASGNESAAEATYRGLLSRSDLSSDIRKAAVTAALEAFSENPRFQVEAMILRVQEAGEEALPDAEGLIARLRTDDRKLDAARLAGGLQLAFPLRFDYALCHGEILIESGQEADARQAIHSFADERAPSDVDEAMAAIDFLLDYFPDSLVDYDRLLAIARLYAPEKTADGISARRLTVLCRPITEKEVLLSVVNDAIAAEPRNHELRRRAGEILGDRRYVEEASKILSDGAAELIAADDKEQAIRFVRAGLALNGRSLSLKEQLATLLAETGEEADALDCWRELVDLAQESGEAELYRRSLESVLEADPQDWRSAERLARALADASDFGAAAKVLLHAASLHESAGRTDQALMALKKAQEAQPSSTVPLVRLALLQADSQPDKAMEALNAYLELLDVPPPAEERESLESLLAVYASHEGLSQMLASLVDAADDPDVYTASLRRLVDKLVSEKATAVAARRLSEGASKLLSLAKFANAHALLSSFPSLVCDIPDLLRHHALSLEGIDDAKGAARLWERLATLHMEAGEKNDALSAARRAIALDSGRVELRRLFLALLAGELPNTKDEFLAESVELAAFLVKSGEEKEALGVLLAAIEQDPAQVDLLYQALDVAKKVDAERIAPISLSLARALVPLGEHAAADSMYEQSLGADPDQPTVLREYYQHARDHLPAPSAINAGEKLLAHYQRVSAAEDARVLREELLRLDPRNIDGRLELVEVALAANDTSKAAAILREVHQIHLAAGNLSAAIEVMHRVETIDPENPETLELLGTLYRELLDTEQAAQYLLAAAVTYETASKDATNALRVAAMAIEVNPRDEAARTLCADIYERLGDLEKAASELMALAELAHESGDFEQELKTIEKALRIDATNVDLRERYANLLSDLEQDSKAAEQFMTLATELQRRGELDGAIDAAMTATTINPSDAASISLLADLYILKGDRPRADEALLRVSRLFEEDGEPALALEALRRSAAHKVDPVFLLVSARLLGQLGETKEALSNYHSVLAKKEISEAQNREASVGAFMLEPGDMDAFRALIKRIEQESPSVHGEVARLYMRAIDRLLQQGEIEQAKELIEEYRQRGMQTAESFRSLVTMYLQHGLPEDAEVEQLALARWLVSQANSDAALNEISEVLAREPHSIPALEFRLELLQAMGRTEDAVTSGIELCEVLQHHQRWNRALEIILQIRRTQPSDARIRRFHVELLEQVGDLDGKAEELFSLAELYLAASNPDSAVECLSEILRGDPDRIEALTLFVETARQIRPEIELVDDYLHLARLQAANGATLQATKTYEHLITIDPENIPARRAFLDFLRAQGQTTRVVHDSMELGRTLLATNNARDGVAILQAIATECDDDPTYHELVGQLLLAEGGKGQALRSFMAAAALYEKAGELEKRAAVLSNLIGIDPLDIERHQQFIDTLISTGRQDEAVDAIVSLVEKYDQRGLDDLADAEIGRGLLLRPLDERLWRWRFQFAEKSKDMLTLVTVYLDHGEAFAMSEEPRKAIDSFRKVTELDPHNVQAWRGFVTLYPKVGKQLDIVDEILIFAQLLIQKGEIDEATHYFELVMKIDPRNTTAQELLSATQSRHGNERKASSSIFKRDKADSSSLPGIMDDSRLSETQKRFIMEKATSASDFLAGALDAIEIEENEGTLSSVVSDYREMISANPGNAAVRVKLADLLEQMGRFPEMLEELELASETYFTRGELNDCIAVCERLLSVNPAAAKIRKRLNEAVVKRDAFKALESAILYTDSDD